MDQVAERLAELRERRALTLRELGEMSGVAADTINQIELGHRKARPSTLRKLARALEIDVQEFYAEPALPKVPAREAGQPEQQRTERVAEAAYVLEYESGEPLHIHFENVEETKDWMRDNLQDAAYQGRHLEIDLHEDGSADIRIMPAGSTERTTRKAREKRVRK